MDESNGHQGVSFREGDIQACSHAKPIAQLSRWQQTQKAGSKVTVRALMACRCFCTYCLTGVHTGHWLLLHFWWCFSSSRDATHLCNTTPLSSAASCNMVSQPVQGRQAMAAPAPSVPDCRNRPSSAAPANTDANMAPCLRQQQDAAGGPRSGKCSRIMRQLHIGQEPHRG